MRYAALASISRLRSLNTQDLKTHVAALEPASLGLAVRFLVDGTGEDGLIREIVSYLGFAAVPAPAHGGFGFGAAPATAPATGGFGFGAPAAPAASAPAAAGFGFGAPASLALAGGGGGNCANEAAPATVAPPSDEVSALEIVAKKAQAKRALVETVSTCFQLPEEMPMREAMLADAVKDYNDFV